MSARIVTVPNLLTVFRMVLIPVFVSLLFYQRFVLALAVFILAGVTDGRMREQHVWRRRELCNGREARDEIVIELRIERRTDCVRNVYLKQRVPIWRSFGGDFRGHVSAGTGSIVHEHLHAPALRQLLSDEPRNDVGAAARRKRQDEANRFRGIRLLRQCVRRSVPHKDRGD